MNPMARSLFLLSVGLLVASIGAQDCSSPRDAGTHCDENEGGRRFYFDANTRVCQPFNYFGCGGNENRFETAADCREACRTPRDAPAPVKSGHAQWTHADKCNATYLIPDGRYVECGKGRPKCLAEHKCRNGVCCPSKKHVCSLRDDTGTFAAGVEDKPRFAWNDEVNSCVRFSYYGAGSNYNNFPSFQSCIKFCKKD